MFAFFGVALVFICSEKLYDTLSLNDVGLKLFKQNCFALLFWQLECIFKHKFVSLSQDQNYDSQEKFGQTELIKMSSQYFSTLFCMQNLKPNNLEFFVTPNSKCEIVDYPMIMLA